MGGGLSIKTLLIAAAASATAAFVVPMFWEPGTVFAAAMSPIIVSVVSELLRNPTEHVSKVTARRATRGAAVREEPFDPLAPAPTEELEALPPTSTRRSVHGRRLSRRQWKLALATGLVAFAGVAILFTASELIAGDRVSGDSGRTTFFGGSRDRERETPTPTPTPTPTDTPSATQTPTPTPTPTVTPTPTATPTPEAAAPEEQPAPQVAPPETPTPMP